MEGVARRQAHESRKIASHVRPVSCKEGNDDGERGANPIQHAARGRLLIQVGGKNLGPLIAAAEVGDDGARREGGGTVAVCSMADHNQRRLGARRRNPACGTAGKDGGAKDRLRHVGMGADGIGEEKEASLPSRDAAAQPERVGNDATKEPAITEKPGNDEDDWPLRASDGALDSRATFPETDPHLAKNAARTEDRRRDAERAAGARIGRSAMANEDQGRAAHQGGSPVRTFGARCSRNFQNFALSSNWSSFCTSRLERTKKSRSVLLWRR